MQSLESDINFLVIFSLKKIKQGQTTQPNILVCLLGYADEAPLENIKMEPERWPENLLISRRSGTQNASMVTELLSSYCGAHQEESY